MTTTDLVYWAHWGLRLSAVSTAGVAAFAWHRGAARIPCWLLTALATWAAATLAFTIAPSDEAATHWLQLRLASIAASAAFFVLLALEVTGRNAWLAGPRLALILGFPLVMTIICTTRLDALVRHLDLIQVGGVRIAESAVIGPWFAPYAVVAYGYAFVAALLLMDWAFRTMARYRRQYVLMSIVSTLPLLGTLPTTFSAFGWDPLPLDWTAVTFFIATPAWLWLLVRHTQSPLGSIARDALVGEMRDAVVVADEDGEIVEANEPYHRLAEQAESDLLPLLVGEDAAQGTPDTRQRRHDLTLDVDGADLHLDVSVTPVGDQARGSGHLIVARDVTEKNRLLRELDDYARIVAHDLRNPIGVIRGRLDLLAASLGADPPPDALEIVQTTQEICGSVDRIVHDLLLLATRPKRAGSEHARVDTAKIVEGVLLDLDGLIEESGAQIERPPTWHDAMGYAGWVREAWANYLVNAIEHAGSPPRIRLGSFEDGGWVLFWVQDNGWGLTEEDQSKLFVELDGSSMAPPQGSGLGLSIVKRVVENLGGAVGVESTVGVGSTFWFTLPAVRDALA